MIRALLVVALVASAAHATPAPMIKPPAGWASDAERAAGLTQKVSALKQFGGAKVIVATEAYVPTGPGVALFVTRVTSEKLVGSTAQAMRLALDDFFASAPKPYDQRDGAVPSDASYMAHTEWTDDTTGAQTFAHLTMVTTADGIVTVRGECLAADKSSGDLVNACVQALYTMDTGVPREQRVVVAPAAASPPEPDQPLTLPEPARITDGQPVHLAPITVAQSKPERDRRPVYLGAGIVVMAAVFWWNRRRRERFDREDAGEPAPAKRAASRSDDDDADDLAAAARGESPKDEA